MKKEYAVRIVEPLDTYLLTRVIDNIQDAHNQAKRVLNKKNVTEAQAHELVAVSEVDGETNYEKRIKKLEASIDDAIRHCGDLDRAMRVAPHLAKEVFDIMVRDLKASRQ